MEESGPGRVSPSHQFQRWFWCMYTYWGSRLVHGKQVNDLGIRSRMAFPHPESNPLPSLDIRANWKSLAAKPLKCLDTHSPCTSQRKKSSSFKWESSNLDEDIRTQNTIMERELNLYTIDQPFPTIWIIWCAIMKYQMSTSTPNRWSMSENDQSNHWIYSPVACRHKIMSYGWRQMQRDVFWIVHK